MDIQLTKVINHVLFIFSHCCDGNFGLLFSLSDFKSGKNPVVMGSNGFWLWRHLSGY